MAIAFNLFFGNALMGKENLQIRNIKYLKTPYY